jgi:hypothetical protein
LRGKEFQCVGDKGLVVQEHHRDVRPAAELALGELDSLDVDRAGCPSAALLDEIGRCDDKIRETYTEGVQSIVATVQLARAVADRNLSDQILESGIGNAQTLMGASAAHRRGLAIAGGTPESAEG